MLLERFRQARAVHLEATHCKMNPELILGVLTEDVLQQVEGDGSRAAEFLDFKTLVANLQTKLFGNLEQFRMLNHDVGKDLGELHIFLTLFPQTMVEFEVDRRCHLVSSVERHVALSARIQQLLFTGAGSEQQRELDVLQRSLVEVPVFDAPLCQELCDLIADALVRNVGECALVDGVGLWLFALVGQITCRQ